MRGSSSVQAAHRLRQNHARVRHQPERVQLGTGGTLGDHVAETGYTVCTNQVSPDMTKLDTLKICNVSHDPESSVFHLFYTTYFSKLDLLKNVFYSFSNIC